ITQDTLGRMIIGTDGGGIIIIDGDKCTNITEKEGLPSNGVRAIAVDNDNTLLIGTDRYGLAIFDGRTFYTLNEESGLSGNHVFSIFKMTDNSFFIATNKGITKLVISRDSVYKDKHGHKEFQFAISNYDRLSGVIQKDFLINSVAQDYKGDVWWGGNRKVTVLQKSEAHNKPMIEDEIVIQHLKVNDSFIDYNKLNDKYISHQSTGIMRFRNLPISPVFES
ncbi:MAG: two-component regulator propeller domain-containing protein, partial [Planktothrix sp.]